MQFLMPLLEKAQTSQIMSLETATGQREVCCNVFSLAQANWSQMSKTMQRGRSNRNPQVFRSRNK